MTTTDPASLAPVDELDTPVAPHERQRPYRLFGEVIYGRVLVCTRCKTSGEVYEACEGATTPEEHDWIDPAEYVCGRCLDPEAELLPITTELDT